MADAAPLVLCAALVTAASFVLQCCKRKRGFSKELTSASVAAPPPAPPPPPPPPGPPPAVSTPIFFDEPPMSPPAKVEPCLSPKDPQKEGGEISKTCLSPQKGDVATRTGRESEKEKDETSTADKKGDKEEANTVSELVTDFGKTQTIGKKKRKKVDTTGTGTERQTDKDSERQTGSGPEPEAIPVIPDSPIQADDKEKTKRMSRSGYHNRASEKSKFATRSTQDKRRRSIADFSAESPEEEESDAKGRSERDDFVDDPRMRGRGRGRDKVNARLITAPTQNDPTQTE